MNQPVMILLTLAFFLALALTVQVCASAVLRLKARGVRVESPRAIRGEWNNTSSLRAATLAGRAEG